MADKSITARWRKKRAKLERGSFAASQSSLLETVVVQEENEFEYHSSPRVLLLDQSFEKNQP